MAKKTVPRSSSITYSLLVCLPRIRSRHFVKRAMATRPRRRHEPAISTRGREEALKTTQK